MNRVGSEKRMSQTLIHISAQLKKSPARFQLSAGNGRGRSCCDRLSHRTRKVPCCASGVYERHVEFDEADVHGAPFTKPSNVEWGIGRPTSSAYKVSLLVHSTFCPIPGNPRPHIPLVGWRRLRCPLDREGRRAVPPPRGASRLE